MHIVELSRSARDFFEAASAALQRRLNRCFRQLGVEPRWHPNIKRLKGDLAGYFRYRVGDYRVVYSIDEQRRVVTIVIIAHRRGVYE
jgi:mRNA interferase RelE/StbE